MIYMRNITITTAKSATYLENVGLYLSSRDLSLIDLFLESRDDIEDLKCDVSFQALDTLATPHLMESHICATLSGPDDPMNF